MLARKLEPEVMDTLDEAVDYDSMDHAAVNRLFADDFLAVAPDRLPGKATCLVLDVGTGTAQIPIELAPRRNDLRITAIDLAAHMLQVAQRNVIRAGLTTHIRLEQVDAKALPWTDGAFDAVISNSIIHQIPEPRPAFQEMVRVLRAGGTLFVRDLLRPPDLPTLERLVATHAGEANVHQQQMFHDSLHAALSLEEVRDLVRKSGLPAEWVEQSSDRHWTIAGRRP